jgi:hypothetical protein
MQNKVDTSAHAPEIDWRKILMEYIWHVGSCEGTDFISGPIDNVFDSNLTPEEIKALEEARDEIWERYGNPFA